MFNLLHVGIGFIVGILVMYFICKLLSKHQGFSSKRDKAIKLYTSINEMGGPSNISFNEFKNIYPDADNILYSKIKLLNKFEPDTIEKVL